MSNKRESQSGALIDFITEHEEVKGDYFQVLDEAGAPISVTAISIEHGEAEASLPCYGNIGLIKEEES